MNWFKWKQWLLALCTVATVNVQGAPLDEWGESTPPISYQSAEDENSGYVFTNSNTHAEYERVYKNENGYSGKRGKQMWLQLPSSDTPMVYLKAKLKDQTQSDAITFQIKEQDQTFTEEGAIWINPSDCSLNGNIQDIPFGARVTTPGTFPYTVEAYVNKEDPDPVAAWDATFYFLENMPSLSLPATIYDDQFNLEIKKGDLEQIAYVSVGLHSYTGYEDIQVVLSSDGFDLQANNSHKWVNKPKQLVDEKIVGQLLCTGKSVARCQVYLKDADGSEIAYTACDVYCPFVPDEKDMNILQKFVADNPNCPELIEYIQQEQWKLDYDDNIRIEWTRETPSHIRDLKVFKQTEQLTLDLAQLESLERLNLYGCKNVTAPLNLSNAHKLRDVFLLGGTNLFYNDIQFPVGFDKTSVHATSLISKIGSPRENGGVEIPINTIVDLAAYIGEPIEGSTTTYSWEKNGQEIELSPVEEGSFQLYGQIGDRFMCEVKNDSFPNWTIRTEHIYLMQGVLNYDERDVAGLKKLATDNPQNQEIQDFINNEVWKESNLYPDNSPMGVQWVVDENNNARLSHLRLSLNDYNEEIAPTKMDISAFTELVYFNSSSNRYIDEMDFSNNTKLEEIHLEFAYNMTSLDLSPCTELKTLRLNYLHAMETVDLSANKKLESLYLDGDYALRSLDLSPLTGLTWLNISHCRNLSQTLDLSALLKLKSLYIEDIPNVKTIEGLDKISLESLGVEKTDSLYKEALQTANFTSVTYLNYSGSNYSLPDVGKAPNLKELIVAESTREVDLNHFPKLRRLHTGYYYRKPALPYSGIKNYRSQTSYTDEYGEHRYEMSYEGLSIIPMPSTKRVLGEPYPCIYPTDTINFSSEAIFNGQQSHFIWIDCDGDNPTEVNDLFVEVQDQPGHFTINPDVSLNSSGVYRCRVWNETFSDGAGVDWYNGWVLDTKEFRISNGESYFDLAEIEMLQKIVEQSDCQELKDWWNRGEWASDSEGGGWSGNIDGSSCEFSFYWNENHRLQKLYILWFKDMMTGNLDLSAAGELERIWFEDVNFSSCVFPEKSKLQEIIIPTTNIVLPIDVEFPSLQRFYASKAQTRLDLSKIPEQASLDLYYANDLKYSGILSPRKMEKIWGATGWIVSNKVYNKTNYIGAEEHQTIDFSTETSIGATVNWKTWNAEGAYVDLYLPAIETGKYDISAALQKQKKIQAVLKHDNYPRWNIYFNAILDTEPGDANVDGQVNVQDISATLPYVLRDEAHQLPVFGYYQADVDANKAIDVADILGILNIIRGRDYSNLRSSFSPVVHLTSEEDGKLYIQTPVALAGLQFTITGADQEIPLLGEADRFAHVAHAGDSLRMVAYSMDGRTIPAGRTLIAQLPKGATLVEAVIADEQARSLEVDLNGVVTATEDVWSDVLADDVTNSPNPFRGQTTFRYGVNESADDVVIRIYSANGMLVRILSGLPASQGEHQYPVSLDLPQGLYYYQLEISRGGKPIRTLSNNMIIK